jgi:hypothetical protein
VPDNIAVGPTRHRISFHRCSASDPCRSRGQSGRLSFKIRTTKQYQANEHRTLEFTRSCGGLISLPSRSSHYWRLTSAANAVLLPQPKPWAMSQHFVMSSIRSREVARAQRSGIRHCEDALKALDFGNDLLGVHSLSISNIRVAMVKPSGTCISCLRKRPVSPGVSIF